MLVSWFMIYRVRYIEKKNVIKQFFIWCIVCIFSFDDNVFKYNLLLILIFFIVLQMDEKERELNEGVVQLGCVLFFGIDGIYMLCFL